jgi:hypothetical protein
MSTVYFKTNGNKTEEKIQRKNMHKYRFHRKKCKLMDSFQPPSIIAQFFIKKSKEEYVAIKLYTIYCKLFVDNNFEAIEKSRKKSKIENVSLIFED